VIDPGGAFGTGAHPTTRLCVELVAELAPAQLLDVGCGSGVISIAAALRGFPHVTAVDIDPAAIDASERNATANGVMLDVRLLDALTHELPPADVIVANVSLEVVDGLLGRIDAATVVCSGYLERDEPSLGRYRRVERRTLDGWAADLLERAE
jgi:ribosomal protein L11 methyltransferase